MLKLCEIIPNYTKIYQLYFKLSRSWVNYKGLDGEVGILGIWRIWGLFGNMQQARSGFLRFIHLDLFWSISSSCLSSAWTFLTERATCWTIFPLIICFFYFWVCYLPLPLVFELSRFDSFLFCFWRFLLSYVFICGCGKIT